MEASVDAAERLWQRHAAQLFSPWVMRAAFRKVQTWYASGEWTDPAEWLDWETHPWERLSELASKLVDGTYRPEAFPVVPYPKRGGRTRHYTMPSVRDQVAFMAFAVLLGPFLEARMPNVSFGNRLFRPRVPLAPEPEEPAGRKQQWLRAPFSLAERRLYDHFQSGYGLYRRVGQWIANRAILAGTTADEVRDETESEPPDLLPYVSFLRQRPADGFDLYYARLDIELAYPSVDREQLATRLVELMTGEQTGGDWGLPAFPELLYGGLPEGAALFQDWLETGREWVGEHPWHLLRDSEELRVELARRFGKAIRQIEYSPWNESPSWGPMAGRDVVDPACFAPSGADGDKYDPHGIWPVRCEVPALEDQKFGLPTGLAVSGLLFNVVLSSVDQRMCQRYEVAQGEKTSVFYLRFVDDVVLLAPTASSLQESIVALRRALGDVSRAFRLAAKKAEPDAVKVFLSDLGTAGGSLPGTSDLQIPPGQRLTRANVDRWVTKVVREVSGLADEGIEEAFGAPGVDRLEQLMELAHRRDADPEVGSESRVSFALYRLAKSSWPREPVRVGNRTVTSPAFAATILLTAEQALRRYPWRFKLMRPALICAVRASVLGSGNGENQGERWLGSRLLPLLAHIRSTETAAETVRASDFAWEVLDDGDNPNEGHADEEGTPAREVQSRRGQHRRLRGSFRRASFWRAWSDVVRTLQRIARGEIEPSPQTWTWHLTGIEAQAALKWFGDMSRWAKILYDASGPEETAPPDPTILWWWEAEALRDAALAVTPPTASLLEALGDPRPEGLRWPLGSKGGSVADELLFGGLGHGWLTAALANTLGHKQGRAITRAPSKARSRGALLWCPRMGGDWHQSRLVKDTPTVPPSLRPARGRDAKEWAALARVGLWDDWDELEEGGLLDRRMSPPRPLQRVPKSTAELWNRMATLDDYAQIRKLMLAHGHEVPWGRFAHWFPHITTMQRNPSPGVQTLVDAMYRLGDKSTPRDAHVPSLELPPEFAWPLVQNAFEQGNSASGFMAPGCVALPADLASAVQALRMELLRPDPPEAVGAPRTSSAPLAVAGILPLFSTCRSPHPMYLLPLAVGPDDHVMARAWGSACLLIWLVSGGEHDLDYLFEMAPWQPSFAEREAVRSRYLLPDDAWNHIEQSFHTGLTSLWLQRVLGLRLHRDGKLSHGVQQFDHVKSTPIRTSICVRQAGWSFEAPCESSPLEKNLRIRMVQVVAQPDWTKWLHSLTTSKTASSGSHFASQADEIAERFAEVSLHAGALGPAQRREHLVMLPEWAVPYPMASQVEQFVRETGVGVLAGLTPRELPRAVPATRKHRVKGQRVLVNEALLVLPEPARNKELWDAHAFRIRKPHASVSELGLVGALRHETGHAWSFARGRRWWRFSYPGWGYFTPAICSEILEPDVWGWLQGRIHHLLVVAWNQDVDLFDQFTWTRGYELYANVATVNHGRHGGTVAWTPKHGEKKEVVRVHGVDQGLSVLVNLPVDDLDKAQREQMARSVEAHQDDWMKKAGKCVKSGVKNPSDFKAPPPDYRQKP